MQEMREQASARPDVSELHEEYLRSVNRRSHSVFRRQQANIDARLAWWSGQSPDGRKHKANYGEEVFPWENASDARCHLVDLYVNQDVSFLLTIWDQMRAIVHGTESGDVEWGTRMTQYLRWQIYSHITEARDEAELLANYLLERGNAIMGVTWIRRRQLEHRVITLEQVTQAAESSRQALLQRRMMGLRPAPEEELLARMDEYLLDPTEIGDQLLLEEILPRLLPELRSGLGPRILKDLRGEEQSARFPYPYIRENRPALTALAPNDDIYIPQDAADIQTARHLFRREILTETQLVGRIEEEGYDKNWVDHIIKTQRGRLTMPYTGTSRLRNRFSRTNLDAMDGSKSFEIIHTWSRQHDSDGVPCIHYTVFSPGYLDGTTKGRNKRPTGAALHELLNYQHGDMPFVHFQRERRTRNIDDSRGYGEIAGTWQSLIKTEWDSQADRASIATLPPSFHPPGQEPDSWGPGVRIPTAVPDRYGFFQTPRHDTGTYEVEQRRQDFSDLYFGRTTDPRHSQYANAQRKSLAGKWMSGWGRAFTQVLQLCQQFEQDKIYYRVVGDAKGKGIQSTREEIQGRFDLGVTFNTDRLDPEYTQTHLNLIKEWMQMDAAGIVDRAEAMAFAGELIDPNLGERLLKPAEAATQHEVEETEETYAKLRAGVPQNIKPGQNYQLRLQILQQLVQQDPEAQQAIQQGGTFAQHLERYTKQLQHQIQQSQNAIIGRLGA